MTYNSNLMS